MNEWIQAHAMHIAIAGIAFHLGMMAEWYRNRETR